MVGWEFPPNNSGGLGVACQGIIENLVDSGEEVVLALPVAMKPGQKSQEFLKTKIGNKFKVIYVDSPIRPYLGKDGLSYEGDLIGDVNSFAKKLRLAVADELFDIVHIHDWLTVPAGLILKKEFGKPLVMHVHSTEFDRTAGGDANKAVEEIEQRGFEEADTILAVSGYTKDLLINKYGVNGKKIKVVHNGVDFEPSNDDVSLKFLKDVPVVLFVGRLTIQKGPEYFVELARRVIKVRPETVFIFVGNGDMLNQLLLTSAYRHLSGSVLFAGFLRDEAKEKMFKRADIFVMPSVSEPFGIVALEAAMARTPVILSKTSGAAEVLPSAIKIDFWDVDLMVQEVLYLIKKSDWRRKLGDKLREEAGAVTWEKTAWKIKDAYQQLVKG